jgi:Ca-activated chloride channel family protein
MFGSLLVLLTANTFVQSQTASQPSSSPAATPPPVPVLRSQQQAGQEVGDEDVIKVTTNLVTSNALVIGRDRRYVPTLRRQDFHLFEDGVEQQIAYFAPIDRPFTLALLIDNSRSTGFELREIKQAAIAFVNKMRAEDQAVIIPFGDDLNRTIVPTRDHNQLTRAIANIKPGGATRLYDAVDFAINQALASKPGRTAAILFTDGVDNDSRDATYQTNLNSVANSAVQVYAVQFSTSEVTFRQAARIRRQAPEGSGFSRIDYQRADAYLHQLAELSGTTLYPAATVNDLDAAVAAIAEELHNEYTLGYYPRSPGSEGEVRRLEVRVNQPQLFVRARTAYSFGPSRADTSAVAPVVASLSEIESRSPFRTIPEEKPSLGARWMCKGPFVPGDYALVQEGFDAKCPASTRPNDKTNAWLIKKPAASEIVCKGYFSWNGEEVEIRPIPTGYAVVGETQSNLCSQSKNPKRTANAWKINRPSGKETVCKGFLIPRGFVVTNEAHEPGCPATTRAANAFVIAPTAYIETRGFYPVP